ncbi:MAG: hypothetical protein OYH77_05940 [Pseudomonadota bacterium]|nr:hypothetical protein [Pseudomonadota bacterium]
MSYLKDNDGGRDAVVMRACFITSGATATGQGFEAYAATANINTCLAENLKKRKDFYTNTCSKEKVEEVPNKSKDDGE